MTAAIMLAGDKIASRPIRDDNKAFLPLRGEPLFVHVARALMATRSIDPVVIVGPRERLSEVFAKACLQSGDRRVLIAEQGPNLVDNAIIGFLTALGIEPRSGFVVDQFDELVESEYRETPGLFLSCDVPLVTPYEIDEFLSKCDMKHYDYAIGLSDESVLEPYRPGVGTPGIRMSCYHLAESRCRHNNLHLGKPLKIATLHNIERMYELRYQKKLGNVLRSIGHIVRTRVNTFSVLRHFLLLQLARSIGERRGGAFYEWIRGKNRIDQITELITHALGVRVQTVFTRFGGAVLDIDNAADLEIADRMYDVWMGLQQRIHEAG